MSSSYIDWDRIINKNVRTKDNRPLGRVTAVDNESIVITTHNGSKMYVIPKSKVRVHDRAKVFLNVLWAEIDSFKI